MIIPGMAPIALRCAFVIRVRTNAFVVEVSSRREALVLAFPPMPTVIHLQFHKLPVMLLADYLSQLYPMNNSIALQIL